MIKLDALTIAILNFPRKQYVYSDHQKETDLNSGILFPIDWNIFRDATASKAKHYQVRLGDNFYFYV